MKRNSSKYLSFLIVVLLLLQLVLPTTAFAAEAPNAEVETEVMELRTGNSQTYKLANGKYRTDIYGADIFYEKNGKFVEIDNTIVNSSDRNYIFENASNSYSAKFRNITNTTPAIGMKYDKYAIAIQPVVTSLSSNSNALSASRTEVVNIAPSLVTQQQASLGASARTSSDLCEFENTLLNDDRTVWYNDVKPNVDYVYTSLQDGIKENIIIRSADAPTAYTYAVKTQGLEIGIEEDGQVYLVDETAKNQVFEILNPYLEDAEGKSSGPLDWEIEATADGVNIHVFLDEEFMNAEDTVYPLATTSTFVTKGTNYTSDTYISSKNTTTNYVTNQYLRTGKDDPYGVRRSYIRFKLPSGYKVEEITAATLQLTLSSKGTSSINPRVYESMGYWKSNQIVWDVSTNNDRINDKTYDGTGIAPTVSGNTYSFNVKTLVRKCYYQTVSNFGYVIKDTNESDTNVWGTFYSSDTSSTSYLPKLSITHGDTEPTDNFYANGRWTGSTPYNLQGYSEDNNSYISNGFSNWNGIDDNVELSTVSFSSSFLPNAEIKIRNDATSSMPANYYAATGNHSTVGGSNSWDGVWVESVIRLNTRDDSIFTPLHPDLKEEIFTHELGHSLGLKHYERSEEPTTCIMQQYKRYCYPNPTSHDKNTLKSKY